MIALLFGSCVKDHTESIGPDSRAGLAGDEPESAVYDNGLDSESDMIVLGEKLTNPYSVEIMREAQRKLAVTRPEAEAVEITVTDLYVRILPQDAAQLDILKNELGLELFDYPLRK